jgi:hypothetical protein
MSNRYLLTLLSLVLAAPMSSQAASIKTFDAPGAGTGITQGTWASAINATGAIAGYYIDTNQVAHGFLRSPEGGFVTFDSPNAGIGYGAGTFPVSINSAGEIAGYYVADFFADGFLRSANGNFGTYSAPGTGISMKGTYVKALNDAGTITGYFRGINNEIYGYVAGPDLGPIKEFEVPGAGTRAGQGTNPTSISPSGIVAGNYYDATGLSHGFTLSPDGTFETFDAPGIEPGFSGTIPCCINNAGAVVGRYQAPGILNILVFVRSPSGTFASFSAPGSAYGTYPSSINATGDITGLFEDENSILRGFIRTAAGPFATFDAPTPGNGTGYAGFSLDIQGFSINDAGAVTGTYSDAARVSHGFILVP